MYLNVVDVKTLHGPESTVVKQLLAVSWKTTAKHLTVFTI